MSENLATTPLTARAVLFGDEDPAGELTARLREAGTKRVIGSAAAGLSRPAEDVVMHDLGRAASGLLDLDLGEVLVNGWRHYHDLMAAARQTGQSGGRRMVRLASHRISARYEPYIDVLMGEAKVARLVLTIELAMEIAGLEASVHAGRLVALHAGDCAVTASLAMQGMRVLSQTAELHLPIEVPLGQGIVLCDAPAQPQGA